ncbi:MAG: photosystem II complex extrinsic protein PsbU [Leptolyngbya sp. SIO4C5]|nr:photosystem II complex extrinsic protein PsbU [Leptolyngbya sp. SIO4C5]
MKRLLGVLMALGILVSGWMGLGTTQAAVAAEFNATVSAPAPLLAQIFRDAVKGNPRNAVDDKLRTEYGSKIDLNNANITAFTKYPGLYPTIARKILANSPFDTVEDVLDMPGLSDREIDRLKANLDNFTVTPPDPALVEGADRFNNGVYK